MYVDETYYNDVFKGEPVESADFPTLCQRAGEIIEEMTLYRLTEEGFLMMSESTQKLVKNAVCAQMEYLDANGGAEMDMGNGMSGATLGKFSYSGASSGTGSTEQSMIKESLKEVDYRTVIQKRSMASI